MLPRTVRTECVILLLKNWDSSLSLLAVYHLLYRELFTRITRISSCELKIETFMLCILVRTLLSIFSSDFGHFSKEILDTTSLEKPFPIKIFI